MISYTKNCRSNTYESRQDHIQNDAYISYGQASGPELFGCFNSIGKLYEIAQSSRLGHADYPKGLC
jgi:hypothetical protein